MVAVVDMEAVAVIGTVAAGMALAVAGMPVVVTGTAVAGMVVVGAGIMVITVAAGELDRQ
jgi:hypothetical protein